MQKSSNSNTLIIIIVAIIAGTVALLLYMNKEEDNTTLSEGDLSTPPPSQPPVELEVEEPEDTRIIVSSTEAWVRRVDNDYKLTRQGEKIYQSASAAVESSLQRILEDPSWYDDIVKRYNDLPRRKKKDTTLEQQLLDNAIYVTQKTDKNIRKKIF